MKEPNRVRQGKMQIGQCYILSGKKGLYQCVAIGINPQTHKQEYTLQRLIDGMPTGKPIYANNQNLVNKEVLYGIQEGELATYQGEKAIYLGKTGRFFQFQLPDDKVANLTFEQLAKGTDLQFGYDEAKKRATKKKKTQEEKKHTVDDFGKPVLGAKKSLSIYQKMSKEELKSLPLENKLKIAKKNILVDVPDWDSDLTDNCFLLKKIIWNKIPDSPSMIDGVDPKAVVDDYIEFVKVVWQDMTEPKQTYEDFDSGTWESELEENLFMEYGQPIPPFNFFNVVDISKLSLLMNPNKEAFLQYVMDNGLNYTKEDRWKRYYDVDEYHENGRHKLDTDDSVLLIKEPSKVKRYTVDQKALLQGMPQEGDWIVVNRRLSCARGKEAYTATGIVTLKATSESEAWEKALEDYQSTRKQAKKKKARLVQELTELKRVPMKDTPVRPVGRNIKESEFEKTFGGWGGVFGQTQSDDIRHEYLNLTFDGLQDMFYALGIFDSTKDLCFGETLSIGFGSHGTGWAEASFKPALNNVINFTTNKGYGHLGRMWFVALDSIAGERLGYGKPLSMAYETSIGRVPDEVRDLIDYMKYAQFGVRSGSSNYMKDTRLLSTMYIGNYAGTSELFARAGATYLLDKFNEKGMRNDFVNGKTIYTSKTGASLNPKGEERKTINELFDKLLIYLKEQGVFEKQ